MARLQTGLVTPYGHKRATSGVHQGAFQGGMRRGDRENFWRKLSRTKAPGATWSQPGAVEDAF